MLHEAFQQASQIRLKGMQSATEGREPFEQAAFGTWLVEGRFYLRLLLVQRQLRRGATARGPCMLSPLLLRGCVGVCWWRKVSPLVLLLGVGPCVAQEVRVQAVRGERHSDRWRSQRHACMR